MEHLIGKNVIFKTIRKPMGYTSLKSIFPEHTFSAKINQLIGDYVLIQDIKLLVSEDIKLIVFDGKYYEIGRMHNLLAREDLFFDRPTRMNGDGLIKTSACTSLIKIKNNLYFKVKVWNQNTDLLKSIQNHHKLPKLYDICFYNLSSMEIDFARKLFNI